MRAALAGGLVALIVAIGSWTDAARGQAASTHSAPVTTTAATTSALAASNPQRSPVHLMDYFRAALIDAERDPARLDAAVRCLDLSQIDPEAAAEEGPKRARELGEIVTALILEGAFDPDELSADPAAPTRLIGREPLLLVLERGADRVWRFSASTVADTPAMYAKLHEPASQPETGPSTAATESAPSGAEIPEFLRTPRAMVARFLGALSEAADDPQQYADALDCMNFRDVDPEAVRGKGEIYAENLGAILQSFLDRGMLKTDELPDVPDAPGLTLGRDPLLVMLSRQPDGRWQFAARTVAALPALCERLTALTTAEATAEKAAPPGVPAEFRSPRATMDTFRKAMKENDLRAAVRCLDVSPLGEVGREASARVLAGKLLLILYRDRPVVIQGIPDDPDYAGPYRHLTNRYGHVEIGRQAGGERAGEWLFTPSTVRSIERLYDAWETRPLLPEYRDAPGIAFHTLPSLWLREHVIPPCFKHAWLGLQYWQWCGLGLVLVAGWVAQRIVRRIVPWLGRRVLRLEGAREAVPLDRRVLAPLALLTLLVTWWGGLECIDLGSRAITVTWPALRFVLVAAGTWALYRLIDVAFDYLAARASRTAARLDDVLVPLIRKTLKVIVVTLGATLMLTTLGFKIEPLLAGVGLGGLAFSFAARDTIANFFGSVNVVLDRPFQVGDWVKIGAHEGVVESVGLRSSRIRTFHDSLLTIPNAEIMNATIDNLGRRRYRRTNAKLTVTYATTPEQLEALCEGIRELIRRHPQTRKDQFYVYVSQFLPASIEILLYCFHHTPDWDGELRERHRLLVDIARLARRLGVVFVAGVPAPGGAAGEAPVPIPADLAAAAEVGRAQAAALLGQKQ